MIAFIRIVKIVGLSLLTAFETLMLGLGISSWCGAVQPWGFNIAPSPMLVFQLVLISLFALTAFLFLLFEIASFVFPKFSGLTSTPFFLIGRYKILGTVVMILLVACFVLGLGIVLWLGYRFDLAVSAIATHLILFPILMWLPMLAQYDSRPQPIPFWISPLFLQVWRFAFAFVFAALCLAAAFPGLADLPAHLVSGEMLSFAQFTDFVLLLFMPIPLILEVVFSIIGEKSVFGFFGFLNEWHPNWLLAICGVGLSIFFASFLILPVVASDTALISLLSLIAFLGIYITVNCEWTCYWKLPRAW